MQVGRDDGAVGVHQPDIGGAYVVLQVQHQRACAIGEGGIDCRGRYIRNVVGNGWSGEVVVGQAPVLAWQITVGVVETEVPTLTHDVSDLLKLRAVRGSNVIYVKVIGAGEHVAADAEVAVEEHEASRGGIRVVGRHVAEVVVVVVEQHTNEQVSVGRHGGYEGGGGLIT